METTKKIIGFTDSVNECDCCGKTGLKGTFCVEINGEELYYGSTCAFKKHGFAKKEVDSLLNNYRDTAKFVAVQTRKQLRSQYGEGNFTEAQFTERLKENTELYKNNKYLFLKTK